MFKMFCTGIPQRFIVLLAYSQRLVYMFVFLNYGIRLLLMVISNPQSYLLKLFLLRFALGGIAEWQRPWDLGFDFDWSTYCNQASSRGINPYFWGRWNGVHKCALRSRNLNIHPEQDSNLGPNTLQSIWELLHSVLDLTFGDYIGPKIIIEK